MSVSLFVNLHLLLSAKSDVWLTWAVVVKAAVVQAAVVQAAVVVVEAVLVRSAPATVAMDVILTLFCYNVRHIPWSQWQC